MNMAKARAGAWLAIDLDAIAANWRALADLAAPAHCAAVVKACAYGLGVAPVSRALYQAGCRRFFVATLDEGIEVRAILPQAEIIVLSGFMLGQEQDFVAHHLLPALNSVWQIDAWADFAQSRGGARAVLQIDTAMNRLGLSYSDLMVLAEEPSRLAGIELALIMSHLACADQKDHPLNDLQCERFKEALAFLPKAPASLAASSGIFLGPDYHFDCVRPGAALYGVNPVEDRPNPMAQVVRLQAKILQIRDVDSPMTVGYGASHKITSKAKIATIAAGYADGLLRSLSNRGHAVVAGVKVPIVGRVSMDLITLDVTAVPEASLYPGAVVDLIGPDYTLDQLASDAGTIAYEILTNLGGRYYRHYSGGQG